MKSIENEWAQQETPLLDIEMRRTWLYHTSKWMTMLNIDTHMREKGPKYCANNVWKQKKLTEHDENEGKTYKAKRDDGKCCRTTLRFWPSLQKRWLTDRAETKNLTGVRHKPNLLHMYSIGKGLRRAMMGTFSILQPFYFPFWNLTDILSSDSPVLVRRI